jgi:hypothetical protein
VSQPRLVGLLLLMVGLAVARFSLPPEAPVASAVVPAVARAPAPGRTTKPPPRMDQLSSVADLAAGTRDGDDGSSPRNAFAVRVPPPAPKPKAAPAPPAPHPFVGPPTPPPSPPAAAAAPPAPPLQVIGGWNDERGASVFVAGPLGVMQVRVGDVVLAEYRVTQIAPRQVQVTHMPTNQVMLLPVPIGTLPALTAAAK